MSGPYTVTESDAETAPMTLDELAAAIEADPTYRAHRAKIIGDAFAIVEHELRSLGVSIDLAIDGDAGVSLAAWPKLNVRPFRVHATDASTPTLLEAFEAVKAKVTR